MADHERQSQTDEWYTPYWVFDAIGHYFDFDPCGSRSAPAIEYCRQFVLGGSGGLEAEWDGAVWLNPPFGCRNGIRPWLEKLADHGNGIALVPNRTATDWFQDAAARANGLLFVHGKIKFLRPDGSEGRSPGYGNVLMAYGTEMRDALFDSRICGLRCGFC